MRRMLWRLALQCRFPHPKYLPPLTPHELAEAMAFYQLEPWGFELFRWLAAQIVTACLQPWSKRQLHVKDHLLMFGRPEKPKGIADKLRLVATAIGAKVKKRD